MPRFLKNTAAALFGLAFAVLLIEGISRVLWVEPPIPVSVAPAPSDLPEVRTLKELTAPNVHARLKGVLFETNRHGCRDREYSDLPGPNVFRIIVVGDSFTAGQGVLGEQAYPNVMENALNRDSKGTTFEVINLGVSGQSMFWILARLESLGLELAPDLIVYGLTLNDIEGNYYKRTRGKFAFPKQQKSYERFKDSPSRALRLAWPRIQSLFELINPPPHSYLFEVLQNYDTSTRAWRIFDGGFDRFAHIQETTGVPVVVFVHTSLAYLNVFHPFRKVYDQIQQAAEKRGLRVIQSLPAFQGHDPASLWVAPGDFHPNVQGHQILATSLLEGLRAMRLDSWPVQ